MHFGCEKCVKILRILGNSTLENGFAQLCSFEAKLTLSRCALLSS